MYASVDIDTKVLEQTGTRRWLVQIGREKGNDLIGYSRFSKNTEMRL